MMRNLFAVFAFLICNFIYGQTALVPSNFSEPDAGSASNPLKIAYVGNLYWLSVNPDQWAKYYIQTHDIHLDSAGVNIASWNGGTGWSPIGNYTTRFRGSYNGQGFLIDSLYINRFSDDYVGLFGYTENSTVSNVRLTNVNITANTSVGGLIGENSGSTISNSSSSGIVSGSSYLGGLVGESVNSKINNSYSSGSESGSTFVGGLLGYSESSTTSNCFWNAETDDIDGTSSGSDNFGATGKSTSEMTDKNTFITAGWDYTIRGRDSKSWNFASILHFESPFAPQRTPSYSDISTSIHR